MKIFFRNLAILMLGVAIGFLTPYLWSTLKTQLIPSFSIEGEVLKTGDPASIKVACRDPLGGSLDLKPASPEDQSVTFSAPENTASVNLEGGGTKTDATFAVSPKGGYTTNFDTRAVFLCTSTRQVLDEQGQPTLDDQGQPVVQKEVQILEFPISFVAVFSVSAAPESFSRLDLAIVDARREGILKLSLENTGRTEAIVSLQQALPEGISLAVGGKLVKTEYASDEEKIILQNKQSTDFILSVQKPYRWDQDLAIPLSITDGISSTSVSISLPKVSGEWKSALNITAPENGTVEQKDGSTTVVTITKDLTAGPGLVALSITPTNTYATDAENTMSVAALPDGVKVFLKGTEEAFTVVKKKNQELVELSFLLQAPFTGGIVTFGQTEDEFGLAGISNNVQVVVNKPEVVVPPVTPPTGSGGGGGGGGGGTTTGGGGGGGGGGVIAGGGGGTTTGGGGGTSGGGSGGGGVIAGGGGGGISGGGSSPDDSTLDAFIDSVSFRRNATEKDYHILTVTPTTKDDSSAFNGKIKILVDNTKTKDKGNNTIELIQNPTWISIVLFGTDKPFEKEVRKHMEPLFLSFSIQNINEITETPIKFKVSNPTTKDPVSLQFIVKAPEKKRDAKVAMPGGKDSNTPPGGSGETVFDASINFSEKTKQHILKVPFQTIQDAIDQDSKFVLFIITPENSNTKALNTITLHSAWQDALERDNGIKILDKKRKGFNSDKKKSGEKLPLLIELINIELLKKGVNIPFEAKSPEGATVSLNLDILPQEEDKKPGSSGEDDNGAQVTPQNPPGQQSNVPSPLKEFEFFIRRNSAEKWSQKTNIFFEELNATTPAPFELTVKNSDANAEHDIKQSGVFMFDLKASTPIKILYANGERFMGAKLKDKEVLNLQLAVIDIKSKQLTDGLSVEFTADSPDGVRKWTHLNTLKKGAKKADVSDGTMPTGFHGSSTGSSGDGGSSNIYFNKNQDWSKYLTTSSACTSLEAGLTSIFDKDQKKEGKATLFFEDLNGYETTEREISNKDGKKEEKTGVVIPFTIKATGGGKVTFHRTFRLDSTKAVLFKGSVQIGQNQFVDIPNGVDAAFELFIPEKDLIDPGFKEHSGFSDELWEKIKEALRKIKKELVGSDNELDIKDGDKIQLEVHCGEQNSPQQVITLELKHRQKDPSQAGGATTNTCNPFDAVATELSFGNNKESLGDAHSFIMYSEDFGKINPTNQNGVQGKSFSVKVKGMHATPPDTDRLRVLDFFPSGKVSSGNKQLSRDTSVMISANAEHELNVFVPLDQIPETVKAEVKTIPKQKGILGKFWEFLKTIPEKIAEAAGAIWKFLTGEESLTLGLSCGENGPEKPITIFFVPSESEQKTPQGPVAPAGSSGSQPPAVQKTTACSPFEAKILDVFAGEKGSTKLSENGKPGALKASLSIEDIAKISEEQIEIPEAGGKTKEMRGRKVPLTLLSEHDKGIKALDTVEFKNKNQKFLQLFSGGSTTPGDVKIPNNTPSIVQLFIPSKGGEGVRIPLVNRYVDTNPPDLKDSSSTTLQVSCASGSIKKDLQVNFVE